MMSSMYKIDIGNEYKPFQDFCVKQNCVIGARICLLMLLNS